MLRRPGKIPGFLLSKEGVVRVLYPNLEEAGIEKLLDFLVREGQKPLVERFKTADELIQMRLYPRRKDGSLTRWTMTLASSSAG